jgi:hypothetical protein
VIVPVIVVIVSVTMVFVFVETTVITNGMIVIPFVVVIHATMWPVPVASEVAAAFVARANPMSADIGRAGPIAFMPVVVSADGVPIAVDKDRLRFGLRRHHHHSTCRGWGADLDADGDLSFGGNASQQKSGKGGDFQKRFHSAMFSSYCWCWVVPGLSLN